MKRCNYFKTKITLILLTVLGLCSLTQAQPLRSKNWHTAQLPGYSGGEGWPGLTDGGYLRIQDWKVVWTSRVPDPPWGVSPEIFLFDGNSTSQVTNVPYRLGNFGAFIDSNNVVWIGDDQGVDFDAFGYNINTNTTTQLTYTADTHLKRISDFCYPNVVVECMDRWLGAPPPGPTYVNLQFYDGSKMAALSPRTFNYGAQVSSSYVVWHAYNSLAPRDIFYYDISKGTTSQLTAAGLNDRHWWPTISGPNVVWEHYSFAGPSITTSIKLCDLSSPGAITTIASSSDPNAMTPYPQVCGTKVVWSWRSNDTDSEIFLYDMKTGSTTPITNNNYDDWFPAISSSYVAWGVERGPDIYEIYVYDINSSTTHKIAPTGTTPLPPSSIWSGWVQASSKAIVWEAYNVSNTINEGFMAARPVCTSIPTGDFNRDCTVDSKDFAIMAGNWGPCPPVCPWDLNGNGKVDLADLGMLLSNWLVCNIQPPIFRGSGATF